MKLFDILFYTLIKDFKLNTSCIIFTDQRSVSIIKTHYTFSWVMKCRITNTKYLNLHIKEIEYLERKKKIRKYSNQRLNERAILEHLLIYEQICPNFRYNVLVWSFWIGGVKSNYSITSFYLMDLFFKQLNTVSKTRLGADCSSDHDWGSNYCEIQT